MPQPLYDIWNAIQTYLSLVPWVIVLILAYFLLRKRADFSAITPRLKRVEVGPTGIKLELFEGLRELQESADKAAAEVAAAQTGEAPNAVDGTPPDDTLALVVTHERVVPTSAAISVADSATLTTVETVSVERSEDTDQDVVETVLREAAIDPKVALLRLSTEIERELTRMLAGAGHLAGRTFVPMSSAVATMRTRYRVLPDSVLNAIDAFDRVRNEIVHGGEGDRDDVVRAIDSGLVVLKTLRGMPKPRYVVKHPGVAVFSDAEAREERQGVKAVIIEKISAGGLVRTLGIHPTTRTHFAEGMEVTWEWNLGSVWGESWYRDPETGALCHGWVEAGEFVGRDLDNLATPE